MFWRPTTTNNNTSTNNNNKSWCNLYLALFLKKCWLVLNSPHHFLHLEFEILHPDFLPVQPGPGELIDGVVGLALPAHDVLPHGIVQSPPPGSLRPSSLFLLGEMFGTEASLKEGFNRGVKFAIFT